MTAGLPTSTTRCQPVRQRRGWCFWTAVVLALGLASGGGVQGYAWYQREAARDALARYQNEAARAHLARCHWFWPHDATAHWLAARAERRAGHLDAAAEHLDQCEQAGQADRDDVAFEWALLRAAAGDLAAVEETLQARVLGRPAEAPLIWEALAAGYSRASRMPEALACLNTWLHFEPDNAYAYFLRGEVHRHVGAVSRARDEYQRVLELNSGDTGARRLLARCLVKLGRYEEAVDHLQVLQAKRAADPELETLRAQCEHGLGRPEAALDRLAAVLRAHPDHVPALRAHGRFALAAGRLEDAEAALRRGLQLAPYDYDAQWALQQVLQAQGLGAEAGMLRARAQQLKDKLERISDIRMREMSARPQDARLHAELGELFLAIGQRSAGQRWLASALQLDPTLMQVRQALAGLRQTEGKH